MKEKDMEEEEQDDEIEDDPCDECGRFIGHSRTCSQNSCELDPYESEYEYQ
jgi:hypothetical protein